MKYYYRKITDGEHAGKFIKVTVNEMIKDENGAYPIVDAEILTNEQFENDTKDKKAIYENTGQGGKI